MLTPENLPGRNSGFILTMGPVSTLKSTLALTAPGLIDYYSFDHSENRALPHVFAREPNKQIRRFIMDKVETQKGGASGRTVIMDQSHCQGVVAKFKESLARSIDDPKVRTISIDTGTQLERILTGAIAGKLNQLSREQRDHVEREMCSLLSPLTKDSGCLKWVVWVHHMDVLWKQTMDKEGKVSWSQVEGEWEEKGRREPSWYADIIARHYMEMTPDGPTFKIRVMSKCGPNVALLGQDVCDGIEDCNFTTFIQRIYGDSSYTPE